MTDADNKNALTGEPVPDTMAPDPDDPYWGTVKIAKMFDVTTETVRNWIESGKLPAVQINGRWKVRKSEAIRLVNDKYGSAQ